jgi:hypothetical protein
MLRGFSGMNNNYESLWKSKATNGARFLLHHETIERRTLRNKQAVSPQTKKNARRDLRQQQEKGTLLASTGMDSNNSIDHTEVSPVGLKQQKCTEESPAPTTNHTDDGGVS